MGEVNSKVPSNIVVVIKSAAALRTYDGFWLARLILAGVRIADSIVNFFICSGRKELTVFRFTTG
jgi:hypothetical protein